MRILFSTIGSRGDVQPVVALASHLKALGHEVRVCVPPDFREWIESLGIAVTPIGPEVRSFARSRPMGTLPQSPPTLEKRRQLVEASVATQFETLTAAAQGCDAIVAATALQVAARSVAEKMGIAYVFAAYAPVVLPSPHHAPPALPPLPGQAPPATNDNRELWERDAARFNDLFGAAVNAGRASLGLGAIGDVRSHMFTDRPWLAADATLGPWPDGTHSGVFQTGAWILPDERPLSRELERFLDSGDPPIYFGFGSTRTPDEAGSMMLHAARALGRRAIVSQGWFDVSLVENEHDCLSISEVNVHALFPRVAAVVHHGGAGTTTAAALAGVPQVVIPTHYDQHYWAQRVHTLGIGMAHAEGAPTRDSLVSTLSESLRPEVAARARVVAGTVRRDGTQVAAAKLLALAFSERSRDSTAFRGVAMGPELHEAFYHGTRADLKPGDLIAAGYQSNYGKRKKANYVYLTATLDAAVWGAELALGDGPGRIYVVEPIGPIMDDPNLTDKKFPGNPTKSFRSRDPLRVIREVMDWQGHSPETLGAMKDRVERSRQQGVEAIDD